MPGEKTASFSINLAGNAGEVSKEAAAELERLRAGIEASQTALKGMGGALRALKGTSEEVAQAKEQLRARIDAERGAVSQASLALLKQGQTYEQLTSAQRKQEVAQRKLEVKKQSDLLKTQTEQIKRMEFGARKLGDGFKYAGGPLGEMTSKLGALKEVASGDGAGMGLLAAGVGIVVVGVVALATAVLDAGVKLGRFIITGADALRSMNLMREAASGSAENAAALGTQVDRLSRLVPTAKTEINALAVAMTRDMSGGLSKATGPTIVAGIEAVTVATAAMGDTVGGKFKELIERGKNFGRFWLNPKDMDETQVQFGEVAAALAKNLHISLDKAKQALFQGGVGMKEGVTALKDAVTKNFGAINADKLLSLDVQISKFHEHLVGLTKGVIIQPLLKGIEKFLALFDETTVAGQAIKGLFTEIGNALSTWATDHIDDAIESVLQLILGALKLAIAIKHTKKRLEEMYDTLTGNKLLMGALKGVAVGLAVVVGAVALGLGALAVAVAIPIAMIGIPLYALYKGFEALKGLDWGKLGSTIAKPFTDAWAWLKGIKWGELGTSIVEGIGAGIKGAAGWLYDAITGIAGKVKDAFKKALGISSPSKVFAEYGKQTSVGYAGGVDESAPKAQASIETMAARRPSIETMAARRPSLGSGASAGASSMTFNLSINLPESMAREKAGEVAQAITAPSVLRQLTQAIREGLVTQGVPTQAMAAP